MSGYCNSFMSKGFKITVLVFLIIICVSVILYVWFLYSTSLNKCLKSVKNDGSEYVAMDRMECYLNYYSPRYDAKRARQEAVNYLQKQPEVTDAALSSDGATISANPKSGGVPIVFFTDYLCSGMLRCLLHKYIPQTVGNIY